MHLEPVEIQHVKLRRSLIGYDREAVDQLLENVTASYEDVWFERDKLEAELASLRNRLDGQAQAKEALEGTVKVAQHTADDLLAEARTKADAVVEDAHQRSLETMQEARVEHQRLRVEIKKLEVAETEITLRLRALLTAARELLDGHESIRELASRDTSDPPAEDGEEQSERLVASNGSPDPADVAHQAPASAPPEEPGADEIGSTSSELAPDPIGTLRKPDLPADSGARDHDSEPEPPSRARRVRGTRARGVRGVCGAWCAGRRWRRRRARGGERRSGSSARDSRTAVDCGDHLGSRLRRIGGCRFGCGCCADGVACA